MKQNVSDFEKVLSNNSQIERNIKNHKWITNISNKLYSSIIVFFFFFHVTSSQTFPHIINQMPSNWSAKWDRSMFDYRII